MLIVPDFGKMVILDKIDHLGTWNKNYLQGFNLIPSGNTTRELFQRWVGHSGFG